MDYLQYLKNLCLEFGGTMEVLNLVINGLPSILNSDNELIVYDTKEF